MSHCIFINRSCRAGLTGRPSGLAGPDLTGRAMPGTTDHHAHVGLILPCFGPAHLARPRWPGIIISIEYNTDKHT
jgi:hypothetical protein